MFKKLLFGFAVLVAGVVTAGVATADDYVRGYLRSNGTYVAPHYRSSRDGIFSNNWSTYPNTNPYTGRTGTRLTPSYGSSRYDYSSPSLRSGSRSTWGR